MQLRHTAVMRLESYRKARQLRPEPDKQGGHEVRQIRSLERETRRNPGDRGGIRTHDPIIKSDVLYRLSYAV